MESKMKTKLSVRRNQSLFKKSSLSSNITAAKRTTNLGLREQTIFNKAYELSTLCDIEVCVIYYGRDGELIKTWPEDKSKVRDMAERFSRLSDGEKRKKSTNLSQCLNKKIKDDKKQSLTNKDNKFSEKVLEMENCLETRLRILQDKLRFLSQTEPDQSREVSSGLFKANLIEDPHQQWTEPLMNHKSDEPNLIHGGLTSDLSPFDPHQQWTKESLMNQSETDQIYSGGFITDLSNSLLNHHQNKFSVFLYDNENGSFCPLPDSVSSLDQALIPCNNNNLMSTALLGPQGFGGTGQLGCNNIDLPMMIPSQMQSQNPLLHVDQFAAWNQTPSFGDPMMFL